MPQLLTAGQVFSEGVSAFLVVAMVAAAMSSLDSVLLVTASTVERDIAALLRRARSTQAKEIRATRAYVVLCAFITLWIARNPPGGIVALTAFSGALYAVCFFPAVILGLYWRRGNGRSALSSFLAGLGVLLGWRLLPFGATVHEVFPGLLASLFTYVLVALRTPPNRKMEHLFALRGARNLDCRKG